MRIIDNKDIISIIDKTLNLVDARLFEHGRRVAYIMYKMLEYDGKYSQKEITRYCILSILHDIGAYKTEEIDNMVMFETHSDIVWNHSVYGYLFIKNMTPLADIADVVLYHHLDYYKLKNVECSNKKIAAMLNFVDKLDLKISENYNAFGEDFLLKYKNKRFSLESIDLFMKANQKYDIIGSLKSLNYIDEISNFIAKYEFSLRELDNYLKMIVYSIDFRSEVTVTHTITMVSISVKIAELLKLSKKMWTKIYYGALLHDLGKIVTPLSILESTEKLTDEQMEIMKQHVVVTEEIIKDFVDEEVCKIACRHHEKIDGSGYPRGLDGSELTVQERIVAIADIISALTGKRSYKGEFDKSMVIQILTDMINKNKICPTIGNIVIENYDSIMEQALDYCESVLKMYNSMKSEYDILYKHCLEVYNNKNEKVQAI